MTDGELRGVDRIRVRSYLRFVPTWRASAASRALELEEELARVPPSGSLDRRARGLLGETRSTAGVASPTRPPDQNATTVVEVYRSTTETTPPAH